VSAASCVRRSRTPNNTASTLPAGGVPPAAKEPLDARTITPKVPRAGGFPKAPATTPPRFSPFASAFQRPLTAHVKAGLCVVFLPAIGAFQRPSTQHPLHYWAPSGVLLLTQSPLPVVFNALGVALAT
jgi:hypothetical protein